MTLEQLFGYAISLAPNLPYGAQIVRGLAFIARMTDPVKREAEFAVLKSEIEDGKPLSILAELREETP